MLKKLFTWIHGFLGYGQPTDIRIELIAFLLNRKADLAGRDDCAIELSKYDDRDVEEALLQVGSDSTEDETILDTCGESLGQIWSRKGHVNQDGLNLLQEPARKIALAVVENRGRSPIKLNKDQAPG